MIEVVKLLDPSRDAESIRRDTADILKFEQKLAKIQMTIEQQRDFSTNYHSQPFYRTSNIEHLY